MAFRGLAMSVVVMAVAVLWTGTAAQSGCTTSALTSLSPCLNFITGSSSTPSSSCCSQLSSVVQSSPQCLCSLLNGGGSSLGFTINQTLALSLPGACKVQTPPVSQCKGDNGPTASASSPVGSPVGSPADSSTESPQGSISPSASDIPSGGGSKTIPSIDSGSSSSDGSTIRITSHWLLLLSLLFILSSLSLVNNF